MRKESGMVFTEKSFTIFEKNIHSPLATKILTVTHGNTI